MKIDMENVKFGEKFEIKSKYMSFKLFFQKILMLIYILSDLEHFYSNLNLDLSTVLFVNCYYIIYYIIVH